MVHTTDPKGDSVLYFADNDAESIVRVQSHAGPDGTQYTCHPCPTPYQSRNGNRIAFYLVMGIAVDRFAAGDAMLYVCDAKLGVSHFNTNTGLKIACVCFLLMPARAFCLLTLTALLM